MSAYSQLSEIISAQTGNVTELGEAIESELPVLHDEAADSATVTVGPVAASAWATIDTVTSQAIAADECVVVVSMLTVSGSNTADQFVITHGINGVRKGVSYHANYTPKSSSTSGRMDTITVVTVWKDHAAGSYNVTLEATANGGTSTGTLTVQLYSTHVFRFKRR
jgi:hypothetical protein